MYVGWGSAVGFRPHTMCKALPMLRYEEIRWEATQEFRTILLGNALHIPVRYCYKSWSCFVDQEKYRVEYNKWKKPFGTLRVVSEGAR